MRDFFIIWRRELAACFLSPVAYVIMIVFLAISGGTFLFSVTNNVGKMISLPVLLIGSIVFWLTVLVMVICMRLFAEEKSSGTIEMLMTAPVTDAQVVLGKYAGALSFLVIVVIPVLGCLFLLAYLSPGISFAGMDIGAFSGGCIILFLLAALWVSIGLVISLTTKNQIIAAICILSAIWLVLLFGWLISHVPGVSRQVAEYVSVTIHIEDFARGLIDTRSIVLYISGVVFMLFTAVRILESRRWK